MDPQTAATPTDDSLIALRALGVAAFAVPATLMLYRLAGAVFHFSTGDTYRVAAVPTISPAEWMIVSVAGGASIIGATAAAISAPRLATRGISGAVAAAALVHLKAALATSFYALLVAIVFAFVSTPKGLGGVITVVYFVPGVAIIGVGQFLAGLVGALLFWPVGSYVATSRTIRATRS